MQRTSAATAWPGRKLGVLAAALMLTGAAQAAPGAWTTHGPYGGMVSALVIDPVNPANVYAAVTGRGIFRSTDLGTSWEEANAGLATGWGSIYSLAVDPVTPSTVYAGAARAVFRSTDSGASWQASSAGLAPGGIWAIAVQPSNPLVLFAGSNDGNGAAVARSTDAGESWATTALPASGTVEALALPAGMPTVAFAGVNQSGVFKTTDSGSTWNAANNGLTNLEVSALAAHPTNPAVLLAGTRLGGVFKSTDAGGTWSPANGGLTDPGTLALAMHPSNPTVAYVGTEAGGVFRSTDSGGTWTPASASLPSGYVSALALHPVDSASLFAATGAGLFASSDSGATWVPSRAGMTAASVAGIDLPAWAPGTAFAVVPGDGIYRSTDSGDTWAANNGDLPDPRQVAALVSDPTEPNTLYAGLSQAGGVFRSTNSGATWTGPGTGLPMWPIHSLSVSAAAPAVVWAATGRVHRSTDGGATWADRYAGLEQYTIVVVAAHPTDATKAFAVAEDPLAGGSIFRTSNGGASWTPSWSGSHLRLLVLPTSPVTLYSTSTGGAYRSTDDGQTWLSVPTPGRRPVINCLAAHPAAPQTIYAGAWGAGVVRSTDGGTTWATVNLGLPPQAPVRVLAVDASGAGTVHAGLDSGSAWKASPPPPAFVKGDVDSDGRPDLLFRSNVDGRVGKVWFMDGVTRAAEAAITPDAATSDWKVRGVDDFDADGRNDLVLWNQVSGQVELWLMNGATRVGAPLPLTGTGPLPTNWDLAATGDFNRDHKPDIVWRNVTSQAIVIWNMNGSAYLGTLVPTPDHAVDGNWGIVAAIDHNGDGNTDFLWYNSTSGKIVTWYMDGWVSRTSGQFTTPPNAGHNNWKVVASADYSRDYVPGTPPLGSPDIVWRNETSGNQVVWHMDFGSARVHGQFTDPPADTPALDWTIVGPR